MANISWLVVLFRPRVRLTGGTCSLSAIRLAENSGRQYQHGHLTSQSVELKLLVSDQLSYSPAQSEQLTMTG
jgi:hypothetical protein